MNHYPHHIGDFDTATRHLTRVERSLYRDLMDLYYRHERPLPADDFDLLAKRVLAVTEGEKDALKEVLSEFFTIKDGLYHNIRCDEEIQKYQTFIENASKAGKASAVARLNGKSTRVKRALNKRATNQEPITNNQNQLTPIAPSPEGLEAEKPLNGHANGHDKGVLGIPIIGNQEFEVTEAMVAEFSALYPAVDVPATLREIKGWNYSHPDKRKTKKGILAHINTWLAREQNKAP